MIMYIYIAITAWLLGLTVMNLYQEEKPLAQITCVLIVIPLLLRVLGIK